MTNKVSNVDALTASIIAERNAEEAAQAKAQPQGAVDNPLAAKVEALKAKKNLSASDELLLALVQQNESLQTRLANAGKMGVEDPNVKHWKAGPGPKSVTTMERLAKQWDEKAQAWVQKMVYTTRREM